MTDVDAIVRAEEEQTRLAAIVGSTTDAIIGKDLQGTITSWNKGAENVLGYTAQEAIGRSVTMLFPPDRAGEEQIILDRLRKGESIERYETVRRRRDGQDISVSLTISPIRDPQGRIVGASKILRDITERKTIEAELERIRHILAEGQRIAHVGSWEYISATQEMVWSDEEKRVYGLDPAGPSPAYEEMLRHHIHPEDAAELDRSFRKAFQSRDVFENETRLIRPDGSARWIYNRAHPYFDSDGRLVKYIGATLDITERKRVEEQLRESHRFISEVTSVLPGVLYIFDLQEQRNVYVNRHTASVLGYSAEEVHTLGADFIPTVLHPDDAIRLLQHFESLKELEDGNSARELSRVTRGSHTDDVLRGPLHDQRPTIRVVLVDDHAMVRQGLRSVLDVYADIHVIGEARDGIEAVNLVEQHRPRVVVMDLNMPRMNGIEATEHIMRRYPDTIVIGISVNMGDDNSAAMQRVGAATLLTKEAAVEQLLETIVQEVVKHG